MQFNFYAALKELKVKRKISYFVPALYYHQYKIQTGQKLSFRLFHCNNRAYLYVS